jgi:flagellin-like hook-associated protein FlgL
MEAKATSLGVQSDALSKVAGDAANADLAEVATRITATQVQYQAIAQTFASLSKLSLLDYLR